MNPFQRDLRYWEAENRRTNGCWDRRLPDVRKDLRNFESDDLKTLLDLLLQCGIQIAYAEECDTTGLREPHWHECATAVKEKIMTLLETSP